MKAKLLILLTLVGLLAGCASTNKGLLAYHDDFTGDLIEFTTDNLLTGDAVPGTDVWLNATRITQKNGVIVYYLEIYLSSSRDWIKIEPGNTLFLTMDGKEYRYDGIGSPQSRGTSKGKFTEHAIYRTTSADIRKLAEAKEVKVKVVGSVDVLQRAFGPANTQIFKDFVAKYIDRER